MNVAEKAMLLYRASVNVLNGTAERVWRAPAEVKSAWLELELAKPVITTAAKVSTNTIFTGMGGIATSNYYVLASTNLALSITSWTRSLTNQFHGVGGFRATNGVTAGNPRQFYVIQIP